MTELIAKPIVKNKMWIVESSGTKVGNIMTIDEGGVVYVHDDQREVFPTIKLISKKYNIQFVKADKPKKEKLEVTVDGVRVYLYDWDKEIAPTRSDGGKTPAIHIKGGFHRIGVAFLVTSDLLDTGIDKSFQRTMNSPGALSGYTMYPHVGQVFIEGPFKGTMATDTASRRKIFECYPKVTSEEDTCARRIITTLVTKAFRRPAKQDDINTLYSFYKSGKEKNNSFE